MRNSTIILDERNNDLGERNIILRERNNVYCTNQIFFLIQSLTIPQQKDAIPPERRGIQEQCSLFLFHSPLFELSTLLKFFTLVKLLKSNHSFIAVGFSQRIKGNNVIGFSQNKDNDLAKAKEHY